MRPESDIIGGRTLGWVVDDSHHVVIREAVAAEVTGNYFHPSVCKPCEDTIVTITYLNRRMELGSTHYWGCFIGEVRDGGFYPLGIEYKGTLYYVGTFSDFIVRYGPGERGDVLTHTHIQRAIGTWDSLAWIGFLVGSIRLLRWDARVIGICAEDVGKIRLYHTADFEDVIQIVE